MIMPWPCMLGAGNRFFAWEAKRAIFGEAPMIVMDAGQTAIKGYTETGGKILFPRDTKLIPFGGPAENKADAAIEFIAESLSTLLTDAATNVPLLMSLPAPLDDACVPGETNYGFGGRANVVKEILDLAEAGERKVYVCNDAELAGACARVETPAPRTVLCLTLGLGPGGAILTR